MIFFSKHFHSLKNIESIRVILQILNVDKYCIIYLCKIFASREVNVSAYSTFVLSYQLGFFTAICPDRWGLH